jgi:hypothetical protein
MDVLYIYFSVDDIERHFAVAAGDGAQASVDTITRNQLQKEALPVRTRPQANPFIGGAASCKGQLLRLLVLP